MQKFIIDTDTYTGNFERELCAFVTGATGECRVGFEFEDINSPIAGITYVLDDDSVERPCNIEPNPNYFNDGRGKCYPKETSLDGLDLFRGKIHEAYQSVAIFFDDGYLTNEVIKTLKARCYEFCKNNPMTGTGKTDFNIEGFRILTLKTTMSEEYV